MANNGKKKQYVVKGQRQCRNGVKGTCAEGGVGSVEGREGGRTGWGEEWRGEQLV